MLTQTIRNDVLQTVLVIAAKAEETQRELEIAQITFLHRGYSALSLSDMLQNEMHYAPRPYGGFFCIDQSRGAICAENSVRAYPSSPLDRCAQRPPAPLELIGALAAGKCGLGCEASCKTSISAPVGAEFGREISTGVDTFLC